MAGNSKELEKIKKIEIIIEKEIRELLEGFVSPYNDPNWDQASDMFVRVITPCEIYLGFEDFYYLSKDIVEEAANFDYRVKYDENNKEYERKQNERIQSNFNKIRDWQKKFEELTQF